MPEVFPAAPVVVSVPARPDVVHILRSVAASVAARSALTVDSIEDLRIAVDEASAQLLSAAPRASTLTMKLAADGMVVDVQLSADGETPIWPPDGIERSLGWQVLKGLSDEVRYERTTQGAAVMFRKRGVVGASPS